MKKRRNSANRAQEATKDKIEEKPEMDNDTFQNRLNLQRKVLEKMINPGMRQKIETDLSTGEGEPST